MELSTLQAITYGLTCFFIVAYLVMDGFDLGAGSLHLFTKGNHNRRLVLNSIGPFWDGNEVWLLVFGTTLFGAFPVAYSTIMTAFYLPFLLFAFALIFRAATIEMRGKVESAYWQTTFDVLFSFSSSFLAIGLGIVGGNVLQGLSLNSHFEYIDGRFSVLLSPYALLAGVTLWLLVNVHGAIFLLIKTTGELQQHIKSLLSKFFAVFFAVYVGFLVLTFKCAAHLFENWGSLSSFALFINVIALLMLANFIAKGAMQRQGMAFFWSSTFIGSIILLFASLSFPAIIFNPSSPEQSITIYNGSGSFVGLRNLIVLCTFMTPLIICYTIYIHRVFKGKTEITPLSY